MVTKDEIRDMVDAALKLRAEGYNCAQCVLLTCGKSTGVEPDALAKIGCSLGGGFAGTADGLCGVLTSMAILDSFDNWHTPGDKLKAYESARKLKAYFHERYGTCICRELKAKRIPCPTLIAEGVESYMKAKG